MRYYGFLALVLASLTASVLIQGNALFTSLFFAIAYVTMSVVLVIGTKYEEESRIDLLLGMLLIFAVAFMSTDLLIGMLTGSISPAFPFDVIVTVALDYCALGFLRSGMKMRNVETMREDERYGIHQPRP